MRKSDKKPRVVFQLDSDQYKKADRLSKADRRKTVSAHAKVVYLAHLESK